MDRRQVLTAFLRAGACGAMAGFQPRYGFAAEIKPAPAFPPRDGEVYVATLHATARLHPGYAYFAGLPGVYGIGAEGTDRWRTRAVADLWHALSRESGLTCMPTGRVTARPSLEVAAGLNPYAAFCRQRIACEGLAMDVATALGADAVLPGDALATCQEVCQAQDVGRGRPAFAAKRIFQPVITRVATPVFAVMTNRTAAAAPATTRGHWQWLDAPAAVPPPERLDPSPRLLRDVDRVAAAIIADTASSDALTRAINSAYFRDFGSRPSA